MKEPTHPIVHHKSVHILVPQSRGSVVGTNPPYCTSQISPYTSTTV